MPESAQNLFRYVLTRSGRALNFQVHEQPEAWRCASPVGDVNVLKREMPSGVVVISENTPDLSGLVVCLRGRQVEGDGKVALIKMRVKPRPSGRGRKARAPQVPLAM